MTGMALAALSVSAESADFQSVDSSSQEKKRSTGKKDLLQSLIKD